MTIKVVNNGRQVAGSYFVNKVATPENLVYHFFTNNITPSDTDTAATYTEATGGGYAAITMTGASWTVTSANPAVASYAQQTWTFTGALTTNPTIYGYYVTRATSLDLLFAETFTAFTPANNGDNIKVTPQITVT